MTELVEPLAEAEIEVWAGGGIVHREGANGQVEILVIHRPHRSDWSFPKGKLDPGETLAECAIREVQEETGLRCRLERQLTTVEYIDRHERNKAVVYWQMTVETGDFVANDEVDEIAWMTPADALEILTYERDAALLDGLFDA